MDVGGILRRFQNFRRKGTAPDSVKVQPLEEIVSRPVKNDAADALQIGYPVVGEPVIVRESVPLEGIEQAKIESAPALYGEALHRHLGYPDWFYDSQKELKRLGVHGEAQIAGARASTPEQIRDIYSRLERIFEYDTRSFVTYVPSAFTYKNSYLENYVKKLRDVSDLLREKFSHAVPVEFDWSKNPALYSSMEGLVNLEARLRNVEKDKTINQVAQNLEAYAGKRILFFGIRTRHKQEIIRTCLPSSTIPTFHSGEDIKGIASGNIGSYDIFVLTAGIATHKVQQRLEAVYGTGFKDVIINVQALNPDRILEIMSQNSYRFK